MEREDITLQDFRHAVEIFGMPGRFTLERLKSRYRQLSRKHHPDFGGDADTMAQVNRAYGILSDYVERYHFQCSDDEFLRQNPTQKYYHQFHHAPQADSDT
ncbi:J domain-containing protein [Desulfurispirillum indicum]|uniref:Heat shock protein DnaJ domain protein n=1 Tax=Desulfurispirillum indicum (strain ATCC BAA-1389 / DSM 22839 / S5) TaxID=653733 RepID=E6W2C1_DESIS|nr:J domain-containing protein [Desulfurispirillum indicum]ADU65579.1 heat shock protein DnaJ domain protein [Desulfurispirillum indicum S5]UCZ57589.1 J domain-containing protein [Desulfurispirillum indicum]